MSTPRWPVDCAALRWTPAWRLAGALAHLFTGLASVQLAGFLRVCVRGGIQAGVALVWEGGTGKRHVFMAVLGAPQHLHLLSVWLKSRQRHMALSD